MVCDLIAYKNCPPTCFCAMPMILHIYKIEFGLCVSLLHCFPVLVMDEVMAVFDDARSSPVFFIIFFNGSSQKMQLIIF